LSRLDFGQIGSYNNAQVSTDHVLKISQVQLTLYYVNFGQPPSNILKFPIRHKCGKLNPFAFLMTAFMQAQSAS